MKHDYNTRGKKDAGTSKDALNRLFFTSVTIFGQEKISSQKIKKYFFSKISSILSRLMHVTSMFCMLSNLTSC